MMASGALVAAAVVTTGLFIGKIANSAASTVSKNANTGTTQNTNGGGLGGTDDNGGFGDDGGFGTQNGGTQNGGTQNGGTQNGNGGGVLPNQNNLPPVGGTHGS
jgi:hypothetical protein